MSARPQRIATSAVSRRGFLQTSAVAGGGLLVGVNLAGLSAEALAAGTHAHAECVGPHRRRQHDHADLGALRDGPGRLHLDADADRRGTERRHPARSRSRSRRRTPSCTAMRCSAARSSPAARPRCATAGRSCARPARRCARCCSSAAADNGRSTARASRPRTAWSPAPRARRRPTASSPPRHRSCRCPRRLR